MLKKVLNRIFDGQNTADDGVRAKVGVIGGAAGIIINAMIFVLEIIVGAVVNSVAITADAFHNLTDVVSSAITIASFKLANKPADRKHPFGHGRAEYLAALIVSFVIMVIGYEFIRTSIEKIMNPTPVSFSLVSLLLILAAIPLKLLLSRFNKNLGVLIGSMTLEASSIDALSDVLVLTVASVSLLASAFTKVPIDGYIGAVVAIVIIYSGFSIARKELSPLLGEAPDPELVKKINEGVLEAEYVSGVHDLIIHNYGPGKFMATIHAEVPCDIPILSIHDSIDRTEKKLSEELGVMLVIHMDPLNPDDEVVKAAKSTVMMVLEGIPGAASFHDLRVVGKGTSKNLIFDVVAGDSVKTKKDEEKLRTEIQEAIKNENSQYNAVVSVDKNYTSS